MQYWAIFKLKVYILRILLINYRYFVSGGPERYMFNVKALLEQAGHEIVPFSIKSRNNINSNYERYFAEPLGRQDEAYFDKARLTPRFIWDVLARLFYSFHVKKRLKILIADTRPDVAYILHHYNKLSPSVIDACKDAGLEVYVRLSDYFLLCPQAHFLRKGTPCEKCLDNGLYEAVVGRCVKGSFFGSLLKAVALFMHRHIFQCYHRVDGFICTTQFMKQKMQKGGWPVKKLFVVPTFMHLADNKERNYKKTVEDRKYILYFGRFTYEKGLDLLVEAYAKTDLPYRNIELMLVGGTRAQLDKLVGSGTISPTVENHVHLHDFLPSERLAHLIHHALFVVVPSRWYENMPNTVLEAYAHGKAVIAMNIGSMPEIVEEGITGLLFEQESSTDLSNKLEWLANEPYELKELENGVIRERAKLNPEHHLVRISEILFGK